jgi:CDP-alcohol phosphatidyltransferase
MRSQYTLAEVRARTYKSRDAWWTVLLVDPLASRLVWLAARYRWITPNRLTVTAFGLGVAAAACFAMADYRWLVAGALLFHLSFVADCMDGKIARLTGSGTVFGGWLDFMLDQARMVICTVALMGGQYAVTGEIAYLAAAGGVLVLDLFRYLNAWQISKVREEMLERVGHATGRAPVLLEQTVREVPASAEEAVPDGVVDFHGGFRSRFATFTRIRNALVRHRIRIHLVSGIEFQMAVCVVGPLTGAVIVVPLVAGALLLAFELLLVYKLWLSTKDFDRQLAAFIPAPASAPATPAEPAVAAPA